MDCSRPSKLEDFPQAAWLGLSTTFALKWEHYLSDLGAACVSEDGYFLLISQSGFMRYAAASVFMANKRFEPSHREIASQLTQLAYAPEDFLGCWRLLLEKTMLWREQSGLTLEGQPPKAY